MNEALVIAVVILSSTQTLTGLLAWYYHCVEQTRYDRRHYKNKCFDLGKGRINITSQLVAKIIKVNERDHLWARFRLRDPLKLYHPAIRQIVEKNEWPNDITSLPPAQRATEQPSGSVSALPSPREKVTE